MQKNMLMNYQRKCEIDQTKSNNNQKAKKIKIKIKKH